MSSPIKQANKLEFKDIQIGQVFKFTRSFSFEDGLAFAKLSGDLNPLHVDMAFGQNSQFKQNVVHGMLVSSLFSTLIGMYCPGEMSLWFSQALNFRRPIFYGDEITAQSTILDKSESTGLITLKMEIINNTIVAIDGLAKVKVLEG